MATDERLYFRQLLSGRDFAVGDPIAAQMRNFAYLIGDRETGGGLSLPVWIEYMAFALRNAPVSEPSAPEGVVQINGEWYFDEFTGHTGVKALSNDDAKLPQPATEAEKKSILDIFKR